MGRTHLDRLRLRDRSRHGPDLRRRGPASSSGRSTSAVGPCGTVLVLLGVDYAHDAVNLEPVEHRARLLEGAAPMDVMTAPVLPEVGAFAEAFRTTPGTRVRRHPSCRFAARGARAEEILEDTPWDDYYGPGSPLDRLCAWGGRAARLGSNPETMTVLHYAEYLADLPAKRTTRWDFVWPEPEGPRHRWVTCLDDANGVADWEGDDYFAEITSISSSEGTGAAASARCRPRSSTPRTWCASGRRGWRRTSPGPDTVPPEAGAPRRGDRARPRLKDHRLSGSAWRFPR